MSELASNAMAWSGSGGGTFAVCVRTAPRWARIEVADEGRPALVPAAPGNGFGLGIVASVTDRTGHSIRPDGGRTAWAEVTWPVR